MFCAVQSKYSYVPKSLSPKLACANRQPLGRAPVQNLRNEKQSGNLWHELGNHQKLLHVPDQKCWTRDSCNISFRHQEQILILESTGICSFVPILQRFEPCALKKRGVVTAVVVRALAGGDGSSRAAFAVEIWPQKGQIPRAIVAR